MSMVPEEAPINEPEQTSSPPQRGRRTRRSGRGRRGRGGRGRRPQPHPRAESEEPGTQSSDEVTGQDASFGEPPPAEASAEPEARLEPEAPPEEVSTPLRPPPKNPASPATIQDAIDHVNRIIDSLRESLDEMEEVLETLELAERQKSADEHEIEQLRRSLRHLQQPKDRERGHSRENR